MMKTVFQHSVIIVALLCSSTTFSQLREISVGATGSIMVPVGSLSKRFVSAPGGSIFFFVNRGTPQWGGAIEYIKFSKITSALSVNRPVTDTVNNVPVKTYYQSRIPNIDMSLEMFGATVLARYVVLQVGDLSLDVGFGAGVYWWTFNRNAYYDTIKVQTPKGTRVSAILQVPALEQQDWSGGINAGVNLGFRLADPVVVNLGARYKSIIGELWPTLALDLENVSTFQMLDLRAGISVDF